MIVFGGTFTILRLDLHPPVVAPPVSPVLPGTDQPGWCATGAIAGASVGGVARARREAISS